jgi:ABC-2 type transport system permease protein
MSKLWLVAIHEYKGHVLTRGFLLAILVVPALIAMTVGIGILTSRMRTSNKAVGYVDHSGWLANPVGVPSGGSGFLTSSKPVPLISYPTEEGAQKALEAEEIQSYYVLAADYLQSRQVQLVYLKPPSENATDQFRTFLQANLVADRPPEIAHRVIEGSFGTARTPDGVREYSQRAPLNFLLPIFIALAFIMLFMTTASTLAQALVEEKENRTIEVLATSLPPGQLVGGKVLGIVGMGLTEVVAWLGVIALVMFIGVQVFHAQWLQGFHVHPQTLGTIAVVAIPTYVLFSALMIALGSTVADAQESQQLGGLFSLFFTMPFYAVMALVEHPNSTLSIALSLFPLTAMTAFCMLTAFSTVPLWQVTTSVVILSLSALGAISVAGRAFRLGMLRYGKRVAWKELLPPWSRLGSAAERPGAAIKPANGR